MREGKEWFEAAGLDVVGVICQKRSRVASAFASSPFPGPVVVDEDRTIAKAWGVWVGLSYDSINIARPASFVVGKDWTIRLAHVSSHQMDFASVDDILSTVR